MATEPEVPGHPGDKDAASTWTVFPSVRDSLGYPQYAPFEDRVARDPETIRLDVPAPPRRLRWFELLSLRGIVYTLGAGLLSGALFDAPSVALVAAGLGLAGDLFVTGWRVVRELSSRARTRRLHLGTTTLTLHGEGLACRSFNGTEASAAWPEIEEVRMYVAGADPPSVHLSWRLIGSQDDVDVEIGPGADLHKAHRALLRWSAPRLTCADTLPSVTDGGQVAAVGSARDGHDAA